MIPSEFSPGTAFTTLTRRITWIAAVGALAFGASGCASSLSSSRGAELRSLPIFLEVNYDKFRPSQISTWRKVFTGELGAPANLTILEETWETQKQPRAADTSMPEVFGSSRSYHVKTALEINGKTYMIEASSEQAPGLSSRDAAVEQAALSIARKAETYLAGYGFVKR